MLKTKARIVIKRTALAFLFLLMSVGPAPQADVYVYKDRNGVMTFTNVPTHAGYRRVARDSPKNDGKIYYYTERGMRYPSAATDPPVFVQQDTHGFYYVSNRQLSDLRVITVVTKSVNGTTIVKRVQDPIAFQPVWDQDYRRPRLMFEGPSLCVGFPLIPFLSCNIGCMKVG